MTNYIDFLQGQHRGVTAMASCVDMGWIGTDSDDVDASASGAAGER